jgi:hypothetical protein
VVKSCPPVVIVGWGNNDISIKLVAPSLQPREVQLFPGMGCMVP